MWCSQRNSMPVWNSFQSFLHFPYRSFDFELFWFNGHPRFGEAVSVILKRNEICWVPFSAAADRTNRGRLSRVDSNTANHQGPDSDPRQSQVKPSQVKQNKISDREQFLNFGEIWFSMTASKR
jgi:hypothetical protein